MRAFETEQRDDDGTVTVSFVTSVVTSGLHVVAFAATVWSPRARTGCRRPSASTSSVSPARTVFVRVHRDIAAPRVSSARVENIFSKYLSVRVLDNPPLPRHGRPQILGKQTVSGFWLYLYFIIVYTTDIGFLNPSPIRSDRSTQSVDRGR